MADDKEGAAGSIKIKRTRRRVYEQPSATADAAAEPAVMDLPGEKSVHPPAQRTTEGAKQQEALQLVRKYMFFTAGAGLVPFPFFDTLAVMALQSRMLKRLCALYGCSYSEQRVKSFVASLIGGTYTGLIAGNMIRLIPVVGLVSLAVIPATSGALTYAVGRVFIQHFECGGTLLDFDAVRVRKYFAEQYEDGRKVNSAAKIDEPAKSRHPGESRGPVLL